MACPRAHAITIESTPPERIQGFYRSPAQVQGFQTEVAREPRPQLINWSPPPKTIFTFPSQIPCAKLSSAMPSTPPDFPYPLTAVHGAKAEAELKRLMIAGKHEGFSPVILGDADELARVAENMSFNKTSTEEILAAAEKISAHDWFRAKAAEFQDDEPDDENIGTEPTGSERLTVPFHVLTGKPHAEIFIARIPTVHSRQIPAYLNAGGWNECSEAEAQVAISRHWHQTYGAELACLSGDIAEYLVSHPPSDKSSADLLAREQYLYCADIVWQGVGTISNLSKTLLNCPYWYFWWD